MALRCPSLGLNHVSDVFGKTYCFALKNVQGFNQGMCDGAYFTRTDDTFSKCYSSRTNANYPTPC